jgi:hypothetical protein
VLLKTRGPEATSSEAALSEAVSSEAASSEATLSEAASSEVISPEAEDQLDLQKIQGLKNHHCKSYWIRKHNKRLVEFCNGYFKGV